MKDKILITGITGFVGSHLADYILQNKKDYEVFGIKRWHLSNLKNVKHILDQITLLDCDITDPISVDKMIKNNNFQIIFHCAAESFVSPSWDHPHRYMSVNYNGTLNFLESLKNHSPKTLFHIPGSGEEYGEIYENEIPINTETVLRPVNPYAVSKIAQDLIGYVYFKSYNLNVIRTRSFNHEGPRREKVFGISWYAYQIALIENNLMKPEMEVGGIDDKRNFTHVKDIVEAYWLSVEKCKPGELYLVGSEEDEKNTFTFREALETLINMSNIKGIKYNIVPKFVRPTSVPRLIADTQKFRQATHWKPKLNFNNILLDTLNYWREKIKKNDHI
jgi:GDP-4-dehydro-6-deoxy-D-mannose reductase